MSFFRSINRILSHDAFGGVFLMLAVIAAMIIANSALTEVYEGALNSVLAITLNGDGLKKPLILWINDGLMAVFFFLVGLELKREILEGKLKQPRDVILPGMAAAGGMIVPALVYVAFNAGSPDTLGGWAIPVATDIAFALGILALVGKRAPVSLKVFLLTLAVLDDLGAILIIALFYTSELKVEYLVMALVPLAGLIGLNRRGAHRVAPALLLGAIMWVFVLKSGVHATIAGVITAFFIPLRDRFGKSPLHLLEDGLTPYVNYLILPVFALANAGVIFEGMALADLATPVPLGVGLGLVVGKQVGVFGVTYLMVRSGFAQLPPGATWLHIYGIAGLAGIGFTMSLFIGSLSFVDPALMNNVRLGVLAGSLVSGMMGFAALLLANARVAGAKPPAPAS